MTNLNVSFLGLGVMGYPMAGFLSKAGFNVKVYNRTVEKAKKWASEFDGKVCEAPDIAAKDADIVFMCVGDDNDVRSVANKAISAMKAGAVLVDHTTASADIARELYEVCKSKQIGFLDAPVSGGQAGAENGQLTIMVGGDESVYKTVEPVIAHYARHSQLLGKCGSGQLAKMMNQICIAGIVQGLSEALHFGQKAGLDCAAVIDVISKGAAQSWQMENRASTMLTNQFDFGFAVDWMRKDLKICIEEAKRNGSPVPVTEIVDGYYAEVQKMGGNRWDSSSLIARLKKKK